MAMNLLKFFGIRFVIFMARIVYFLITMISNSKTNRIILFFYRKQY